jgi:iron complex outermembrane receptor protein
MVLANGLNFYMNGSASNAYYSGSLNAGTVTAPYYQKAPSGLWVAQTPTDTEAQGLTYTSKGLDLGFFNKRIGEMRVDNKAYHNQAIIAPFSTVDTYINYTVRNHSIFDQTKVRLSANNLLDAHNLQSLTLGTKPTTTTFVGANGTTYTDQFNATTGYASAGADSTGIMAGRSFAVSVTFGFAPKGR